MDSNIDPEINAASMVPGSQAKSKNRLVNEDQDHIAVDTATQLLKVLLYQIPEEDKLKDDGEHVKHGGNFEFYADDASKANDEVEQINKLKLLTSRMDDASSSHHVLLLLLIQPLSQGSDSGLNFVMMDPSTKEGLSKRLGRPRRTLRTKETPQQSSLHNSSDSIISRFRFDDTAMIRGVAFMGSKMKPNVDNTSDDESKLHDKKNAIKLRTRRVIEHLDGFKVVMEDPGPGQTLQRLKQIVVKRHQTAPISLHTSQRSSSSPTIVLENIQSLRAKGRSTARDTPPRFRADLGIHK